jgi:hypothetical protein
MRQPTTAEVRLDEGKATSSGAVRPSESLFLVANGVGCGRISLRCASMRRKIAPDSPGIWGCLLNSSPVHNGLFQLGAIT